MILADFHIHSTFSDGRLTVGEIVDFYGQRGFGAISITDHLCEEASYLGQAAQLLEKTLTRETFPYYLNVLKQEAHRAWEKYRMVLIPGVEITKNHFQYSRSAHMLALGIDRFLSAEPDMSLILDEIHAQGAIAIAAHPVSTRKTEPQTFHLWDRRHEFRYKVDAWEVASGPYLFDEVKASGLPMLASSDLHHPSQMTSWKTVVESEKHPEAILQAIKKQHLSFRFYRDRETTTSLHAV
jgi:predicted metal-dependent phosphoesterase TrpH